MYASRWVHCLSSGTGMVGIGCESHGSLLIFCLPTLSLGVGAKQPPYIAPAIVNHFHRVVATFLLLPAKVLFFFLGPPSLSTFNQNGLLHSIIRHLVGMM